MIISLTCRDPTILGSAEESADLIGRCFGKDASAEFFHLSALTDASDVTDPSAGCQCIGCLQMPLIGSYLLFLGHLMKIRRNVAS